MSLVERPPSHAAKAVLGEAASVAAVVLGLAVVTAVSMPRLVHLPYPIEWREAIGSIWSLLPDTGWAALRVWVFWGWSTAVFAGILLAIEPELGLCDAILGGAAGLWAFAFLFVNIFGPIGLCRASILWTLLAGGSVWLGLRRPPALTLGIPSSGQKLALLGVVLLSMLVLPVQLSSPVVPYTDALSWVSAAQRIVTFHTYLPFDNNPYGLWSDFAQAPSLEAFYAVLALGSHTRLMALAESGAMVPMLALIMLGVYRLGQTFLGDVTGGMAAILFLGTTMLERGTSMRASTSDFALVGVALGLFLDSRQNPTRTAVGALLLGASIPGDPIFGGLAMGTAAGGVLLRLAKQDRRGFAAGAACLAGALLFGAPEFPIALAIPLRYPILLLGQLAGIAIILAAVNASSAKSAGDTKLFRALSMGAVAAAIVILPLRGRFDVSLNLYPALYGTFPLLTILAVGGFVLLLAGSWIAPGQTPNAGVLAFALLLAVIVRLLEAIVSPLSSGPVTDAMIYHVTSKMLEYWCPYCLLIPAALPFAFVYRRWSRPVAVFAVLAVLIYPSHLPSSQPVSNEHAAFKLRMDNEQHSLIEQMYYSVHIAARGAWAGSPDRHWIFGPAEFALLDVLDQEISAGRITVDTHILHLTGRSIWSSFVQYAAFTGINDDTVEYYYDPHYLYYWGGRVRPATEFDAAMAQGPPYVLLDIEPPDETRFPPDGYKEIFRQGDLRLFRREPPAH